MRWPLGALALLGLPAAVHAFKQAVLPILHADHLPFWIGLALVVAIWILRWHRSRWARFITTIEHEILHALVGMLTLIPVRELKVREDGSGHVLFEPPGHWLLYLAPYFIPLLLWIEISLVKWMHLDSRLELGLLGMLLGLELLGHFRQLHPRQTDFQMAGRAFSMAFLPSAFILAYAASISAMSQDGVWTIPETIGHWGSHVWTDLQIWSKWAWQHFS